MKIISPQFFFRRTVMIAALVTLFNSLSCGLAQAASWEAEYAGDTEPIAATPRWVQNSRPGESTAEVRDGCLEVRLKPGDSRYYTMGFFPGGKAAGAGAWNGNSGTSTIEFRVSCQGDNPEQEIFQLSITDGKRRWDVNFQASSITARGKSFEVDTSKPETYRITLSGEFLTMTSETHGPLFQQLKGAALQDDRNRLVFGTDSRNRKGTDQGACSWSLDFIRWTNQSSEP